MSANNKAIEEALEDAVARMAKPPTSARSAPADPITLIATILPKLLENRNERTVGERIESLRTEDIHAVREQLQHVRARLRRLDRAQAEVLSAVDRLQQQQTAIGEAVIELARQMARVDLLDDVPDVLEVSPRGPAQAAPAPRPAGPLEKKARKIRRGTNHE